MSRIDHTFITLEISVSGVTRECEARVEFIHTPAFAATVERGSGVHTQLAEAENAEITGVYIDHARPTHNKRTDIMNLLTDSQIEAISTHILEG